MLIAVPSSLLVARSAPPQKSRPLPRAGEFSRFSDPVTEATVVRLTNPHTTSLLPLATNRFISSKQRFLIFSSDRTGRACPFQLDLRTGGLHQLAETADLLPRSLCLDARERSLFFIDKSALRELNLANKKVRTIADGVSAFSMGSLSPEFFVVSGERLKTLDSSQALAEDVTSAVLASPKGEGCIFEREISEGGREFWYVAGTAHAEKKPVLLAKGQISNPFWSPDGQSLLFLRDVESRGTLLSEIHQVIVDTGVEQRVAMTTQFAAFAPNGDATVFVGASRSRAQPNIMLLLRSVRRELTLCEHRASHPASVSPVFSPDSRRIYFQSDREGKWALYSVNVELLVEPTPSG